MSTDYAERHQKTSAGSSRAMGGAASGMGLECLTGDTEMVTTFDDFNGIVKQEGFDGVTNWETCGWILTEDQGAGGAVTDDMISMNDGVNVTHDYSSCIRIFAGTDDQKGGSMKLDVINGATGASTVSRDFPHIWVPETATIPAGGQLSGAAGDAAEGLDNTTWAFATRVGFRSDDVAVTGAGEWEGAFFIGWVGSDLTSVLDHDTGVVTTTNLEGVGFHVCILGEIYGVSQRLDADAVSAAVGNYTQIHPTGAVHNTVANNCSILGQTVWWDLALRMDITNMNDNDANGTTTFYTRRVIPGEPLRPWAKHETVLTNETPNCDVALVPYIELINGTTADQDASVLIDWWAMGRNRVNR